MAEQQLNGPQIAGSAIDQRGLGSAQGMRAKQAGIEPDAADPSGHEARVFPCCHPPARTSAPTEQEFARLLASNPNVVIDRLSGLLGQFEPNGPPGLLLSHCRPID